MAENEMMDQSTEAGETSIAAETSVACGPTEPMETPIEIMVPIDTALSTIPVGSDSVQMVESDGSVVLMELTVPPMTVPAVAVPAMAVPAATVPAATVPAVTVPAATVTASTACTKKTSSAQTDISGPAAKKIKISITIDGFIDRILKSSSSLQAIMSDEYTKSIALTKVYVGQVKYQNEFSKIIKILNEKLPLKNLSHLKRACRKEVLLFPTSRLNKKIDGSIQYYMEENFQELRDSFEYFKVIEVPSEAPRIRKQYVECGRTWSCNFHPDKYLEKLYNGELFNEADLKDHRIYMAMAFEVARYYLKQKKQNVQLSDIFRTDVNVTVIVDPTVQSVVAIGFDNRGNNPIQHSTMIAIDNVAKTQHGGVWLSSTDIYSENLRGVGMMDLLLHLKKEFPAAKFGARDYVSKSELADKNLTAAECPYLCTEYYVYMIKEPCLMCAMALVHARANRVFFYKKHSMGALVTKTKLHCVPSLNHRYEVFTGFV